MSDYYAAVAQVVPVLFIVIAFELSRTYRFAKPGNPSARAATVAAALGQVATAALAVGVALQALRHGGRTTEAKDTLIVLGLVCFASAIAASHLLMIALERAEAFNEESD